MHIFYRRQRRFTSGRTAAIRRNLVFAPLLLSAHFCSHTHRIPIKYFILNTFVSYRQIRCNRYPFFLYALSLTIHTIHFEYIFQKKSTPCEMCRVSAGIFISYKFKSFVPRIKRDYDLRLKIHQLLILS